MKEALNDPTSFLVISAERALGAELPSRAGRTVLGVVGTGTRSHSAILPRTGLSATAVNDALGLLQRRAMVRRLTPYSTRPASKTALWEIIDPYMRFRLRFVEQRIDLIERGRGTLLVEDFERSWPAYRGRAIEHLVRDAVEFLLPDEKRFGPARHVGGFWNRTGTVELDLVGGDARPVAQRIAFVGSIKWRTTGAFTRADALALARSRDDVPGADERTLLVGVSSQGFDADAPLDVRLSPEDLIDAFSARASSTSRRPPATWHEGD